MSRYGNVKAGAYTKMNLEYSSDTDLENLNDIEKVLGKIGIRIRSTNTEFRSFSDVLEELSNKWINLDTVSKNAIATAMAGVRQREQFLVLMENMDRAEELEQVSANSKGTAEQKYAAYMETIESAQNRLSNAWSEMAQRLEESGVVKAFTDVAVFITQNLLPALNAFASFLISYNGFKIPTLVGNMGKKIASMTPRFGNGRDEMYQSMIDWQDQNKLVKDPITGKYHAKKSGFLEQYVDKQLGDDFVQGSNSLNEFSATVDKATGSVKKLVEQNQEDVEDNKNPEDSKNLEENQDKQPKASSKASLEELTNQRDAAKANLEQAAAAEKTAKAKLDEAEATERATKVKLDETEAFEANKKELEQQAKLEEHYAKIRADAADQEVKAYGQSAEANLAVAQSDLEEVQANRKSAQTELEKAQANRQSAQSEHQDAQANLKDAQTEYANAQANLQDAQSEYQGAQTNLSSGLKSGASSSMKGAVAGVGISALTSGITTGMSTEGSTKAKAVTGTVSGTVTAAAGGIGLAIGGPLGAAIGSSLGSMLGSIFGPMIAEAIDKEENDRKKRIEDATKLLDTLKSQESTLEAMTAMSKQESLLSNDIKAIRQYVQDIRDSNKEDSTGRRTFEELLNKEAAEAKQQGRESLIERLKAGTAQSVYDNLDLYLANDSTEEARELRKELTLFLKQANVRAQKNAFLGSKEGKTLSSSDKRELLRYEIQEAYLASGISNQGSSELAKKGIKAAYQEVVDAVNKNRAPEDQLLLTSDVQKMIHLLMEEDDSTSVQSLLVGGNYTLSDIVHNTYKFSEEVQNDLLTQAALALGLSVDDVKARVDEFGLLTVGDLNSSVSDLSDALSSLTSYFDELMSTGALSLNSLKEIISANGDMATSLGEKDFSYLSSIIPQNFAEIGRKHLENWSQGSASGAGIYKKLAGSDDAKIRAAFQILEQEGFTEDKSSLNNLYTALKSNKFGQDSQAAAGAEEIWNMYFQNYLKASENIDNIVAAEYEKTTQSAQNAIDRSLQRQQNALEEQKSALEEINSQREYENKLIEAKIKLENAQNEKKKVWREGVGWVYEADTSAIADAQKELDKLDNEKKVNELQVMIDELQAQRDWMSNLTESKEFEKAQNFMKQWANNADSTMAVLKFWENAVNNPPSFNTTDEEKLKANKLVAETYKDGLKLDSLKQAYTDLLNTQGGKLLLKGGTQAQLGQMDESDIKAFNTAVNDFQTAYDAAADQKALTNNDAVKFSGLTSEDIKNFNSMHDDTKSVGHITSGIGTVQNIGKSDDWSTKLTIEEGDSDLERLNILLSLMNGSPNYRMKGHEAGSLTPTTTEAIENGDGRWSTTWRKDLQVLNDDGTWFRPGDAQGENTKNVKQKYSKHFIYNQATGKYYYIGANGVIYDAKFTPSHATGTLSAHGGLSLVNDDQQYGLEGIITPQGTLTALPSKSGVVPADMTRNVWQLGEVAPNLIKQLVDINGKFNSPLGFGTDESFNVDHLDVHMVAQPGFDMDDFVRQLRAARDLSKHS